MISGRGVMRIDAQRQSPVGRIKVGSVLLHARGAAPWGASDGALAEVAGHGAS
jgi:hypothetical protein